MADRERRRGERNTKIKDLLKEKRFLNEIKTIFIMSEAFCCNEIFPIRKNNRQIFALKSIKNVPVF